MAGIILLNIFFWPKATSHIIFHLSARRSFRASGFPKSMLFLKNATLRYSTTPVKAIISKKTNWGKKLILKYLKYTGSFFDFIYCIVFAGNELMSTFASL